VKPDSAGCFPQQGSFSHASHCLLLVQGQVPGFSTRLHLTVGRDVQDITVYRNVSVVGLTTTFNGGIAITVSAVGCPPWVVAATLSTARMRFCLAVCGLAEKGEGSNTGCVSQDRPRFCPGHVPTLQVQAWLLEPTTRSIRRSV
jgi:hypothetical protein